MVVIAGKPLAARTIEELAQQVKSCFIKNLHLRKYLIYYNYFAIVLGLAALFRSFSCK